MRRASIVVMLIVAAILAPDAIAAPAAASAAAARGVAVPAVEPSVPEPPRQKGRWYGWELILSDTLSLLLAGDGANQKPESPLGSYGLAAGLIGLAAIPPALHLIHGNPRRTGFGLLVRGMAVGLWAAALLSSGGGGNDSCTGDHGCVDIDTGEVVLIGAAMVAAGGAITYAAIDDFWFARAPVPPSSRPSSTIVPTAFVRAGGGGLSLVGRF